MTYFTIGKLYQNVTKNEAWPLFLIEPCGRLLKRKRYLSAGDTFIPLDESQQDSNYIHLKLLADDGVVYRAAILKNSTYIQIWFKLVSSPSNIVKL